MKLRGDRYCKRRVRRPIRLISALGILGCVFASTPTSAAPATPRPPSDPWDELPAATLEAQPVSGLTFGKLKVWLEFNTLGDVAKISGSSPLSHYEDNDVSYDWLCYDTEGHHQRLWFISDTDNGGPQHTVTSIEAMRVDAASASTDNCPLISEALAAPELDRGVWLGTSQADLEKKLGEASSSLQDWLSFYANHRMVAARDTPDENGSMEDDVLESSYLNVRVVEGRVVQLVAGKLTGQ
jgi:hypothetical protein